MFNLETDTNSPITSYFAKLYIEGLMNMALVSRCPF